MKKMNHASAAAFIVAAGLVASACSSDDNKVRTYYPKDNVVRVVTNVSNMLTRGSITTSQLTNMGLSIYNTADPTVYTYGNVEFTKASEGGTWTPAQLMLWQNKDAVVNIVAYAPYKADYTMPADKVSLSQVTDFPVSVQPTQTATDYSSDFLVYKRAGFKPYSDLNALSAIPVNFRHALSQLNISIKLGTEFDQPNKLTASPIVGLTVGGTKTSGTYDFTYTAPTTGEATTSPVTPTGEAQNVQPYESKAFVEATGTEGHEVSNATATYSCILLPQTVAANGFTVSFTIGDKTYQWTSTAEVTLASGCEHSLELRVGKDVVVPGTFTVTKWDETTDPRDLTTD